MNNKEKLQQRNQQYREKNKEKLQQQNQQYREENKGKLQQHKKQYYNMKKENIKEYYNVNKGKIKQYYNLNKEKIKKYYILNKEKLQTKYVCECGGSYTNCHKSQHMKSLKHDNYIKIKKQYDSLLKLEDLRIQRKTEREQELKRILSMD
jgi:hypothetical protein